MDKQINEQERKALELAAKYRHDIKEGVSQKALKALKKRFNYDLPAHLYETNKYGIVLSEQDVKLIQLHAAVRDGQREVITYIAQIISDDE